MIRAFALASLSGHRRRHRPSTTRRVVPTILVPRRETAGPRRHPTPAPVTATRRADEDGGMDAYRFLSRCGRLATEAARELFGGLQTFGAALIGAPLPPEAFPPATPPAGRATSPGGPVTGPGSTDRPPSGESGRSTVSDPGRPTIGEPERPANREPGRPASRVGTGGLPAGAEAGAPPAGHPERLIPHVPPTPTERRLWSQLR
ncbi:DUF6059 family protein [Micromonospora echinospora]|uniref:DUF6059 family protein n=1 Tax=Micromonospora echinospora TaxID=1877 RepID=UPI0037B94E4B